MRLHVMMGAVHTKLFATLRYVNLWVRAGAVKGLRGLMGIDRFFDT
jgi:hypothetical protein